MSEYPDSNSLETDCGNCVLGRLCLLAEKDGEGPYCLRLKVGEDLPDTPPHCVYVLLGGVLEVSGGHLGQPVVLGRIRPGEVVGLEAVETGRYRGLIRAVAPAAVCAAPIACVRRRLDQSPALGFYLARLLGHSLVRSISRQSRSAPIPECIDRD